VGTALGSLTHACCPPAAPAWACRRWCSAGSRSASAATRCRPG
jgi:hypothetical protein